ncbi:MAG: FAD binding domain-containing protein [Candidatus Eisenbacteria bacterium]
MLPLPRFRMVRPRSLAEALDALAEGTGAEDVRTVRLLAGGTDLVPNLKHGLYDIETLVDLKALPGLRGVARRAGDGDGGDGFAVGALTTLAHAVADPALARAWPALAHAWGEISGPQLRAMGTVGGNLCLDTRCTWVNQTEPWRAALGHCLKRSGTKCHVVPGGTRCVAAMSSDGATMLLALGGSVVVQSAARGERTVPLAQWFLGEGRANTVLAADEILVEARVPAPGPGAFAGYRKLRARNAIDYPLLSVAVAGTAQTDGTLATARVVVGALGARPREVGGLDAIVAGQHPSRDLLEAVGMAAYRQCRPLTNIPVDPEWRHQMVPVLVRRALAGALGLPAGPPVPESVAA